LLLVFVLHALLGGCCGLSVDEAHYLLYAAHPALSYFDHPPLVGWVQIPLVALDAPVAMLRVVPGVCWLLTVWGVHRLTLRLFAGEAMAPQAALAAVSALALAPLLHVLGIGLLPDTLLMALTVALMQQTWTLMQPAATTRVAPWVVMGVLPGLSGLAKYTAVFTAAAIAVCVVGAQGLRVLRLPALCLGLRHCSTADCTRAGVECPEPVDFIQLPTRARQGQCVAVIARVAVSADATAGLWPDVAVRGAGLAQCPDTFAALAMAVCHSLCDLRLHVRWRDCITALDGTLLGGAGAFCGLGAGFCLAQRHAKGDSGFGLFAVLGKCLLAGADEQRGLAGHCR